MKDKESRLNEWDISVGPMLAFVKLHHPIVKELEEEFPSHPYRLHACGFVKGIFDPDVKGSREVLSEEGEAELVRLLQLARRFTRMLSRAREKGL